MSPHPHIPSIIHWVYVRTPVLDFINTYCIVIQVCTVCVCVCVVGDVSAVCFNAVADNLPLLLFVGVPNSPERENI